MAANATSAVDFAWHLHERFESRQLHGLFSGFGDGQLHLPRGRLAWYAVHFDELARTNKLLGAEGSWMLVRGITTPQTGLKIDASDENKKIKIQNKTTTRHLQANFSTLLHGSDQTECTQVA